MFKLSKLYARNGSRKREMYADVGLGAAIVGLGTAMVGAPTPGWVGAGAPDDHEALVIETAGTVLLRPEICMCFTPSLVYELTCASPSTQGGVWRIPLL